MKTGRTPGFFSCCVVGGAVLALSFFGSPASAAPADQPEAAKPAEPFAFADFTWLNGNSRTKESPIDFKYFTGEFRADTSYIYSLSHPKDDTLVGSSETTWPCW